MRFYLIYVDFGFQQTFNVIYSTIPATIQYAVCSIHKTNVYIRKLLYTLISSKNVVRALRLWTQVKPRLQCITALEMYLNVGFLRHISKRYESLISKINVFDSVRVWLYLIISKLDLNVLVIPTRHFGLAMTYVPCRIALATFFEIVLCYFADR
jgi:hypothetical protein